MCQYIVNKCIQPIDFGYNMLYLYRLLRVNIGSKRQAPGNRSTQSHASPKGTGRLPKTERMMSNNQTAQKFFFYFPSLNDLREGICNLFAIPENLFFRDFFVSARLAETAPTLRFVSLCQKRETKRWGITTGDPK